MPGPKDGAGAASRSPDARGSGVRQPAVAGMFYPRDRERCLTEARELIARGRRAAEDALKRVGIAGSQRRVLGVIVPHAGWICSGEVAAQSLMAIARDDSTKPDVVVVFAAVHTPLEIEYAALDTHAAWAEPFDQTPVVGEVRAKLLEAGTELFATDDRFHRREHAVEVELPLIELACPATPILPVEVPTVEHADRIGIETARRTIEAGYKRAVFLASSDLTHYGPAYGMAPGGVGLSGLAWARDNDRRLLDLIEAFEIDRIVPEVRERLNACGGGAIAAMMSACRELEATTARVLRHTNSYQTLSEAGVRVGRDATDNAVGYASAIVY